MQGLPCIACLLTQSDLFHEVLVVPKQPLVVHRFALPVSNSSHADSETFSGRWDRFAIAYRHRLRERTGHYPGCCRPGACAKTDGVLLDRNVWSEYKQRLQIFNMLFDALCFMAIRPSHDDIFGVTLS